MKARFIEWTYLPEIMGMPEETVYNNYEWELLSITDSFWNWKQAHILCDDWKVRSPKLSEVTFIK
jgi:hypothetical protein